MKKLYLSLLSILTLIPQYTLFAKTPEITGFTKVKNTLYTTFTDGHPNKHDDIRTYSVLGRQVTVNWSHCVSIAGTAIGATGLGIESQKESDKRANCLSIGSLATLSFFSLWKTIRTGKLPITITSINTNQTDTILNKSVS